MFSKVWRYCEKKYEGTVKIEALRELRETSNNIHLTMRSYRRSEAQPCFGPQSTEYASPSSLTALPGGIVSVAAGF